MAKVNLDALIPREDFEVKDSQFSSKKKETVSIEDLKFDSFFFTSVRKPDFQRETNEWEPKKIGEFIESFIVGDLIPAVILWRSNSGLLFVIDGSHRLSALAAWINDDYGDGKISKNFYDGIIPEKQISIAQATRKLISKKIGSYQDYVLAISRPDKVKPEIAERVKALGSLAIQLQWVEGDANKAETSFFKINRQASPINDTELILLESRRKPNCIAARAIIRSGKGHKYWSKFSVEKQQEIQDLAEEINKVLFEPDLISPIKTLDLPIGGKNYSAQSLSLILDLINLTNFIKGDFKSTLDEDYDGEETIKYLKKCRKAVWRLNSNHPSSLGLHPIVYFYSADGRYKIASFLAVISWVLKMERENTFDRFIKVREEFEKVLLNYEDLIQQIVRKYRSSDKSINPTVEFYEAIIKKLQKNITGEEAVREVMKEPPFDYLRTNDESDRFNEIISKDFSAERKSAVYIKEALANAPKCKICNGLMHRNSISIDHIQRVQDGGLGTVDNGQVTHPYCNTTFKN